MKNKKCVMLPNKKQSSKFDFVIDHKYERENKLPARLEVFEDIPSFASGLHNYDFLCRMDSWDPYGNCSDAIAQTEMNEILSELNEKVTFYQYEEYFIYSRYKGRNYRSAFATGIEAYKNGETLLNCMYKRCNYQIVWKQGWEYAKERHDFALDNIGIWIPQDCDIEYREIGIKLFLAKYEFSLSIAC